MLPWQSTPTNRQARRRLAVTTPGWTSWIVFAGVMMIISGGLNAMYGLIAVVNNESVMWTNRTSSYLDIAQRGAVHLDVGLVLLFSGIGVFSQEMREA